MTIRQEIRRRAVRANVMFYIGMAVGVFIIMGMCVLLGMLHRTHDPRMDSGWLPLLAMAAFMTGSAFMLVGPAYVYRNCLICCRSNWPLLHLNRVALDRMKCCPYCGRSLDDKLPAKGRHGKSKTKGDVWEDELA